MRDKKGQALVEFIIILPIFLLLIISLIDFGNIFSKKYSLENDLDTVVDMYKSDDLDGINDYVKDKDIKIEYKTKNDMTVILLSKDIKVISPIVNVVLGKNYNISVDRSIYKDE